MSALTPTTRERLISAYLRCGYRRARGKVGGQHRVSVSVREHDVFAWTTTEKAWGRRHRRGFTPCGINSEHHLAVLANWGRAVYARGLAIVDGMLTMSAAKVRRSKVMPFPEGMEVFEAAWVRQGRGTGLKLQRGYIARDLQSGITIHVEPEVSHPSRCDFPSPAHRAEYVGRWQYTWAKWMPATIARRVRQADRHKAALANATPSAARLLALFEPDDLDKVVTTSHSVKAGNCISGTRDWVARHFPGRRSATIRELLVKAAEVQWHDPRTALVVAACRSAR